MDDGRDLEWHKQSRAWNDGGDGAGKAGTHTPVISQ